MIATIRLLLFGLIALGLIGCTQANDPVVAEYDGNKLRASEAFSQFRTQIYDLEDKLYDLKEQAISAHIEQKLLTAEAARQKIEVQALIEKEAGGAVQEVTDQEMNDFLLSQGLSLKDSKIPKDQVREYLKYRKVVEKREEYVEKLREKAKVKLLLPEPESVALAVTTEGYPSWGNPKAAVTVVEFSDFQCPVCSRSVVTIQKLKQHYGPDKIRIVFRDLPIERHARANAASLAAHCANDQGKFWEYHDLLFQNQAKLEDTDLKAHAIKLGMNGDEFSQCLKSAKHQAIIDQSKAEAEKLNINGTPSFLINGKLLPGLYPLQRFKDKIDKALKKS